ncbi:galactokinase [Lachnospiraceae bacterium oral taxon 500]|nr:galactokinase [Lachnospiraceae bacterium oral taxon 500]
MEKVWQELTERFDQEFGRGGERRRFFTPGRVNLIGEHIDYNGGRVFPCALDIGTYALVRPREDTLVRFVSTNMELKNQVDISRICYEEKDEWTNYPKGTILQIQEHLAAEGRDAGVIGGMDILYHGNIPNGSGLSSSASIEVLTAAVVNQLWNLELDMVTLVQLCQKGENTFNGVNSGIMDQFAVGMGRENCAIYLDTSNLNYEYVPCVLGDLVLIIGNTNKKRGLADSKYNERREECNRALTELQKVKKIQHLCELSAAEWEEVKGAITDDTICRRAEHAVMENARVKEAVAVLQKNDMVRFGQLLNASHDSLRDLYDVTGSELDTMVEEARKIDGVYGARMTGAGFGGCTVSLVKKEAAERFRREVGENYQRRTGLMPEFYIVNIGGGAREIL